jgi:YidC/Oxa1 family membrane protein insertase
MIRIASRRIAGNIVARVHVGVISSLQFPVSPTKFERPKQRTFATNVSTPQTEDISELPTSVEETLDKIFQEQEIANAAADTVAQETWTPVWYNCADQAVHGLNAVRDLSGLGYGESIVLATVLVRLALFPLFVKLQRNSARMAHMQPEMQALKKKMDSLGSNVDQETQMKFGLQMRALMKKYDCNPFSSLLAPIVQIPVFMGMFFGLRKMPQYFGPDMSNEGILWFHDLTAYDPYYVLPVASAMTMLASVEMNKAQMVATNPGHGQFLVNAFRSMSIVMVPAIATFPASLNLYWLVNNTFTAVQAWLFQNKKVRKALGIWEMPKPVPGMPKPKGILEAIENVINRKPTEGELIKSHNEAVESKKKIAAIANNNSGRGPMRGFRKFRPKS